MIDAGVSAQPYVGVSTVNEVGRVLLPPSVTNNTQEHDSARCAAPLEQIVSLAKGIATIGELRSIAEVRRPTPLIACGR